MSGRSGTGEETVQAFECARCGERLDGPDETCSDPFCDGEVRNIGVGRE